MMSTLSTENRRAQAGFTLVELAIVLVIVGLLIGGILKGQELISATRVNSTVSQIKSIDAATYTFVDTYGGMPGDLVNANNRLNGCSAVDGCAPGSNITTTGNGHLDGSATSGLAVSATTTTEGTAFFVQLGKADLIGGINNPSTSLQLGRNVLTAPIDSNSTYRAGYETAAISETPGSLEIGGTTTGNAHYFTLSALNPPSSLSGNMDGAGMEGKTASSIDSKMDDGSAAKGSIRGITETAGTTAADSCITSTDDTAEYRGITNKSCALLIRFYQ